MMRFTLEDFLTGIGKGRNILSQLSHIVVEFATIAVCVSQRGGRDPENFHKLIFQSSLLPIYSLPVGVASVFSYLHFSCNSSYSAESFVCY